MIKPEDVGQRIRELRKRRGLSLRALAKGSGVAVSFLARVESGRGSPTLATLLKLLEALDTSTMEFFAAAATAKADVIVQRRADMQVLDDGDKVWRFLFPSHRDIQAVMTYEEYRPGTRNAEQERHPADICGLVMGGVLTLEVPGQSPVKIKAGDSFYIRAGTSHTATNRGRALLRLIAVEIPRGGASRAPMR
jgi:transcriptional regulator with XRE-family HTH domain